MSTGHDLQREDEPLPGLDDYLRVVACAAAMVRSPAALLVRLVAGFGWRLVRERDYVRLVAALEAAGVDVDNGAVAGDDGER